jgi:tetratricopeptide (TPR) repeat protein
VIKSIKIFLSLLIFISCSDQYSKYALPLENSMVVLDHVNGYDNIDEALEDFPNSQNIIIQKLKTHQKNNWNTTSEEIKSLLSSSNKNLIAYQLAAEYFLKVNNIKEALNLTSIVEENGAKGADFYELKSLIYTKLEKYTEAIDYINKAILLNRSDFKSYFTKGRIYLNLKDTVSAIKYMNLGLDKYHKNYTILYEVSDLYEKTKQYDQAEGLILEAMSYAPNEENLKLKYAEILIGQNKIPKAKSTLRDAFLLNNSNIKIGLKLSDIYMQDKKYDSVILITDQVLMEDSTNLFALRNKAYSYGKKGHYNSSIVNYEMILSQDSLFENAKEELNKVLANRAYLQKIKDRRAAMPVFENVAPKKKINNIKNE